MSRASIRARLLALSIGMLLAAAGAAGFLYLREPPPSVRVVDDGWLGDLLDRRSVRAGSPAAADELLVRNEEDRAALFRIFGEQLQEGYVYDPLLSFRRASHMSSWHELAEHPKGGWLLRTNGLGMRNDAELSAQRPDMRVLVTGDSHTEGVCSNDESFAARIGADLEARDPRPRVEVLNAGVSGYAVYNYLGVLERYGRELAPDVFVVVLYGGNDFSGTLKFQRYFHARPKWAIGPYDRKRLPKSEAMPQEFTQLVYFLNNPGDVEVANRTLRVLTAEMQGLCEEMGIRLVGAYLPPPTRGQPRLFGELAASVRAALGLPPDYDDPSDRMATAWLAYLAESGIPHVDLREAFGASDESCYWTRDSHINLRGHRIVAEQLAPLVARALGG